MTSPGAMGTTSSWDRETDVVVLGSGAAGLTAALTAAVNGASVEVYEKAGTVGGTSAVSGGIVWVPAHRRMHASVDDASGQICVAGTALIGGLLKGLFDAGVVLQTRSRATELIAESGTIAGVRVEREGEIVCVRARRGVVLGTGGFEWDESL